MAVWQIDPSRVDAQIDLIDAELKHLRLLQKKLQQYADTMPEQQAQLRRIRQKVEDLTRSRNVVRQSLEELQGKTRRLSASVQEDIQTAASDVMRLF